MNIDLPERRAHNLSTPGEVSAIFAQSFARKIAAIPPILSNFEDVSVGSLVYQKIRGRYLLEWDRPYGAYPQERLEVRKDRLIQEIDRLLPTADKLSRVSTESGWGDLKTNSGVSPESMRRADLLLSFFNPAGSPLLEKMTDREFSQLMGWIASDRVPRSLISEEEMQRVYSHKIPEGRSTRQFSARGELFSHLRKAISREGIMRAIVGIRLRELEKELHKTYSDR